jgi:hypothetical protein
MWSPTTQEALPDSPRTLGSRTDRSRHMGFWEGGGKQRIRSGSWPLRAPSAAPALGWVGTLGRGAASDAHGPAEKAELAFQSAES